jgi:hypothetical protein
MRLRDGIRLLAGAISWDNLYDGFVDTPPPLGSRGNAGLNGNGKGARGE